MTVLFDCVTSYISHSHRVRPESLLKLDITACFTAATRHLSACQDMSSRNGMITACATCASHTACHMAYLSVRVNSLVSLVDLFLFRFENTHVTIWYHGIIYFNSPTFGRNWAAHAHRRFCASAGVADVIIAIIALHTSHSGEHVYCYVG